MPVHVVACYPDTHLCRIGSNVWQLKPYTLQPQLKVAFNEVINEIVQLIHGLSVTSAVAQNEIEKKRFCKRKIIVIVKSEQEAKVLC